MVKKETVHIFLLLIFILTPGASLAAQDYAAWSKKNPDGSWTRTAEIAVAASSLPSLEPKDIGKFCPTYKRLPPKKRIKFWVGLLSAMARPESSFNPGATHKELFKEKSGKQGISRGLLQISIESANQPGYRCGIKKAKDLHNPAIHLPCAVKILSTWVAADDVIATYKGDKKNRGGGRYWAVLREKNGPLSEISNFTKNLSFCRHPTGDEILQEAARRMSGILRGYDRIGRYGGEEFLITASGCDWSQAMALGERICSSISGEPVNSRTGQIVMTVSVDIAMGCGQGEDAGALIAAADEALYRAKEAGRNRVEMSSRMAGSRSRILQKFLASA